jgi:kynurenine formamidase
MIASLNWGDIGLHIDLTAGCSIAITLDPHGSQPSFFAGQAANAKPLAIGDYIGDVHQGGSCNAEVLEFIPHCHGTHTECRSHVDHSGHHVLDVIDQQPCLARLVTLSGTKSGSETVLEKEELQEKLSVPSNFSESALIIRTLPNDSAKQYRDYSQTPGYPVLSSAAIQWLSQKNLRHLLLDTPSLDRANDGGSLQNHRVWWQLDEEGNGDRPTAQSRSVTEMIYVPDKIKDGFYWLELQLQPLAADATSSRPVIYPVDIQK